MRRPQRSQRPNRVTARRRLLKFEPLEVRNLLAVFTVDSRGDTHDANLNDGMALDSTNKTTLRAAIEEANALPGADIIQFDSTVFSPTPSEKTITLSLGELNVRQDLTINGGDGITVSGADQSRVFRFGGAGINEYVIFRLTIADGNGVGVDQGYGGAIYMQDDDANDTLFIENSIVRDSEALTAVISEITPSGGGISVISGDLVLVDSVVADNASVRGGGISVIDANADLENVTISTNVAADAGGGIDFRVTALPDRTMTMYHATIVQNTAMQGGGVHVEGTVASVATVEATNSLFAFSGDTPLGPNPNPAVPILIPLRSSPIDNVAIFTGGVFLSRDANLTDRGELVFNGSNDQVNVTAPLVLTLADNGGETLTHALQTGSPAIDTAQLLLTAGPNPAPLIPYDQRTFMRDNTPDIGAFELNGAAPPFVSISINDAVATDEGNDLTNTNPNSLEFFVSLSEPAIDDVTVLVNTSDMTALAGSDYVPLIDFPVLIRAGDTMATVPVELRGDLVVEANETFSVSLRDARLGGASVPSRVEINSAMDNATGTIDNDDMATLSITAPSITESNVNQTAQFIVQLNGEVQDGFNVAFSGSPGTASASDFQVQGSSLAFNGSLNETQMIDVTITGDMVVETNETFTVTLGAVTGPSSADITSGAAATGIIDNDDMATLSITAPSITESNIDETAQFTVQLNGEVQDGFDVAFSGSPGTASASDFQLQGSSLAFTGSLNEAQMIDVTITGDMIVETNETFTVTLGTVTGTAASADITSGAAATGIIDNDDMATLSITAPSITESNINQTAQFTVQLNGEVQDGFDVAFSGSSGTASASDFQLQGSSLAFTGSLNETQMIDVTITGDMIVETNETFTVTLGAVTGTSSAADITSGASATGIIDNDDMATLSITAPSITESNINQTAQFTVQLNGEVQDGFDVAFSGSPGAASASDFQLQGSSLAFTGSLNEAQMIDVTITGDMIVETNETFTVTLGTVTGTAASADITSGAAATGIIDNDDMATLSITAPSITESNIDETAQFTVQLNGEVQDGFDVAFSGSPGTASASDFQVQGSSLAFTGSLNETQMIDVTITGDMVVETNETFTVTLGAVTGPSSADITSGAAATGTIDNDDSEIRGVKWNDMNGNGVRDPGEPGLPGWMIYLDQNNNGMLDPGERSAETGVDGTYVIDNPPTGSNTVREMPQVGWEQTFPRKRFEASSSISTGTFAGFLDVVNLDNVGQRDDLIVVNDYSDATRFEATITLLINAGAQGFQATDVALPDHVRPQAVYVGDLNRDGSPDLAVASAGERGMPAPDTNGVLIYLNDGGGNFPSLSEFLPAGDGPSDIVGMDLNRDGFMDLVTSNYRSHDISILLGNQNGGFDDAIHRRVGDTPVALDVGHINNDPFPDLAIANLGSGTISVRLGTGDQSLFEVGEDVIGIEGPVDVVLADISDDGVTDLAAVGLGSDSATVFSGDGKGAFAHFVTSPLSGTPTSLAAGDVNNDGRTDLMVSNAGQSAMTMLINLGGGVFGNALDADLPNIPGINSTVRPAPQAVALADLDGDLDLDLAVAHFAGGLSVHRNVVGSHPATIGVGDVLELDFGNFQIATPLLMDRASAPRNAQINVADVNADGVVSPTDVRLVINHLNRRAAEAEEAVPSNLDVNGDHVISPMDVLQIVNRVNAATHRLTATELATVAEAALDVWATAGLDSGLLERLGNVDLRVADLAGDLLAVSSNGQINIDVNAAGAGWYVDASPGDHKEFVGGNRGLQATHRSSATAFVDLLAAVLHEQGHLLGLTHDVSGDPSDLMSALLPRGIRRLPSAREAALAEWF